MVRRMAARAFDVIQVFGSVHNMIALRICWQEQSGTPVGEMSLTRGQMIAMRSSRLDINRLLAKENPSSQPHCMCLRSRLLLLARICQIGRRVELEAWLRAS